MLPHLKIGMSVEARKKLIKFMQRWLTVDPRSLYFQLKTRLLHFIFFNLKRGKKKKKRQRSLCSD